MKRGEDPQRMSRDSTLSLFLLSSVTYRQPLRKGGEATTTETRKQASAGEADGVEVLFLPPWPSFPPFHTWEATLHPNKQIRQGEGSEALR